MTTAHKIITRYAEDVAFVAQEDTAATTLAEFTRQLTTAAEYLSEVEVVGAEDAEAAAVYLSDAIHASPDEQHTLLGLAARHMALAGDGLDEYRLMV